MMNGFKGRSRGWKEIEIKVEREETYQPKGSGVGKAARCTLGQKYKMTNNIRLRHISNLTHQHILIFNLSTGLPFLIFALCNVQG